jgi:hypothetical protein
MAATAGEGVVGVAVCFASLASSAFLFFAERLLSFASTDDTDDAEEGEAAILAMLLTTLGVELALVITGGGIRTNVLDLETLVLEVVA